MYTITKKPHTPNILWDAENGKPLCRFEKGIIKTNDDALAKKLKAMGYTVEGKADKKTAQPEDGAVEESSSDTEQPEQETEQIAKPAARRTRK